MDFGKVLIRCSSLGCLFTEPKSKADKDAGNLSQTAKTHLIEVYAREIWGVEKDLLTKQMKKGVDAEAAAISLLSVVDGCIYEKNHTRGQNEWISGHADIVLEDEIIDTKVSWDAFSFLPKLAEEIDKTYYYQLQGYLWLWNKKVGRIAYCLVDTPDNIIQGELYRLLRSMDVVSEDSPEYKKAADKLISNMKFSHIDPQERVIEHYTVRSDEVIEQIPAKVAKAREFLKEFHTKHMNLSKKDTILV